MGKPYIKTNTSGKLVSRLSYSINPGVGPPLESRRFPSPLLAVNAEARQAALEFYHIRLPASVSDKHDGLDATFYLNPDWDYVRFLPQKPTDLLDFLWDTRACDLKGNGLKHTVVAPLRAPEPNKAVPPTPLPPANRPLPLFLPPSQPQPHQTLALCRPWSG
ncbi:hypothetical protein NKR19_g5403 [Coniochaeta hoffmannii]|uniref:Uncharacterized protein n=1 Tax=Coniochaeta hoffmannii TaxID=91930 RepID=A0AA38S3R1_9PEZI|nr:hypothetical protein NKR19_g5403 [Coniochaeta hoffmannii]